MLPCSRYRFLCFSLQKASNVCRVTCLVDWSFLPTLCCLGRVSAQKEIQPAVNFLSGCKDVGRSKTLGQGLGSIRGNKCHLIPSSPSLRSTRMRFWYCIQTQPRMGEEGRESAVLDSSHWSVGSDSTRAPSNMQNLPAPDSELPLLLTSFCWFTCAGWRVSSLRAWLFDKVPCSAR